MQVPKKTNNFVLFVDLKAAFDCVDHEILFEKLEKIKIEKEIINTIKFIYSNAYTSILPKY